MGRKYLALGILFSFLYSSVVFAAPVRMPSSAGQETSILGGDGKLLIGVGAEYDYIDTLQFEGSDGEAGADVVDGILSFTWDKKFSVYGTVGQMMNPEFIETGDSLQLDDAFIWGVGANAQLFEQDGWVLFTDASYRITDDMDFDSMTLGGVQYTKADLIPGVSIKGEFEEWQVALGVSKDFEWIKPYAGLKYSDVKFTGKFDVSGGSFEASSDSKDNVGVFVGAAFTPVKSIELNIQGRFVDETALMGSVTFKF